MTVGVLVEKPSAAKNFSKALGGMSGTFNGESYIILNSVGHIYEYKEPSKQVDKALSDEYKSWKIDKLPWDETDIKWDRSISKGKKNVVDTIKAKAKNCSEIVIATDVDPSGEGDLIAWEILLEAPILNKKITRLYFSDEHNPKDVQNGFINRKVVDVNDGNYQKALFRSKWDFLSMQFTRVATNYGYDRAVLRQGRLKSAMVLLVGDQLKKVSEYKKIPFYSNKFKDENGNIYTSENEPIFKTKGEVPQNYTDSNVIIDKKQKKKSAPPKYLDLSGLSSMLAPKGLSAQTLLNTYQKMYESGIVSYPRTEDKTITPEQFNDLLALADDIADLVGVDKSLLTHRQPRSTHVKKGGIHGANRPGLNVPKSLDSLKKFGTGAVEIYVLLAKNYLASLAEDYEYELQEGHLEKYPDFKSTARVPLSLNFKLVFDDKNDEIDEDDDSVGLGTVASLYIHEGFPPKPRNPTQRWLMDSLKKEDIGTGATRVTTFSDVVNQRSKYPLMNEKRGKLTLTEYGEMSYALLPGTNIGSLLITKMVFDQMKDIADGKLNSDKALGDIKQLVKEDIITMGKNASNSMMIKKGKSTMSNQQYEVKEKATGMFNGKAIKFNRQWSNHRFTDEEVEKLLNGEEIEIYDLISKDKGTTYGVRGKLAEQEYNGHKFYGFKRLGFANKPGVPDQFAGYKFSDDEKFELENGGIVECVGCVSKGGNNFDTQVRYDKDKNKIIPEFSDEF